MKHWPVRPHPSSPKGRGDKENRLLLVPAEGFDGFAGSETKRAQRARRARLMEEPGNPRPAMCWQTECCRLITKLMRFTRGSKHLKKSV